LGDTLGARGCGSQQKKGARCKMRIGQCGKIDEAAKKTEKNHVWIKSKRRGKKECEPVTISKPKSDDP